jgi:hypothetical protein
MFLEGFGSQVKPRIAIPSFGEFKQGRQGIAYLASSLGGEVLNAYGWFGLLG